MGIILYLRIVNRRSDRLPILKRYHRNDKCHFYDDNAMKLKVKIFFLFLIHLFMRIVSTKASGMAFGQSFECHPAASKKAVCFDSF